MRSSTAAATNRVAFALTFSLAFIVVAAHSQEAAPADEATAADEARYIQNARQLIFSGLRSGEGYFSGDGSQLVFQSERQPENPFYQIYRLDFESGDIDRVSTGTGKTTCGWIHPDGQRILYATTQFDPAAQEKQRAELEKRASGKKERYSWDYDPQYELVMHDFRDGSYRRLSDVEGYDAECAISPDGQTIVFASNRRAYDGSLSAEERKLFEIDPASAMDLYAMDLDGSNVRRLTDTRGYDGGPFFSPDGSRICWRRFDEGGAVAEIFTMAADGGDVQQLTTLGATSWAPFYHPSGDYLIFTTNLQGFANFELYAVDAGGTQPPVRITYTDGFDGLPSFNPQGNQLLWSSGRTPSGAAQLFIADWNHTAVREALQLSAAGGERATAGTATPPVVAADEEAEIAEAARAGDQAAEASEASFAAADVGRHVDYLCRPELQGRLTGTPGERAASAYVAAYMQQIGLQPAFDRDNQAADAFAGGFTQPFEFTAGIELGKNNDLAWGDKHYAVDESWRPLALSSDTQVDSAGVVFAGYGIAAPDGADATKDTSETAEYDSYTHLDVAGKWVLAFRGLPMDVEPARRAYLGRFASLRYKAMAARERGAAGLIVVSGPTSQARSQLVPLSTDGSLSGSNIAAISVTDEIAAAWLAADDQDLGAIQKELDGGEMQMGFELPGVLLSATVDVDPIQAMGLNTVGWLPCDDPKAPTLIVGAHIDHLGSQAGTNSLAREDERNAVHRGADDNASGVAGMLEIAQYLTSEVRAGRLKPKTHLMFAAWSGEELGLLGSDYFVEHLPSPLQMSDMADPHAANPHAANPHAGRPDPANPHASAASGDAMPRIIAAYINLDMVGRLRDNLVLQGIGSSPYWRREIEQRNSVVGLPLVLQEDSYLPTDASTFYIAGVPVLSAFTGQHAEYHTPRDVPELLNFEGAAKTARLLGLIARSIVISGEPPEYTQQAKPENAGVRSSMSAYLGTIPDYASGDIEGIKLSGVGANSPAAAAGLRGGDVVVELAGRKVANIYDYTYAIEALKIGEATEIAIRRGEETLRLEITPASRQ